MLFPNRRKYNKAFKGKVQLKKATKNNCLTKGDIGLMLTEPGKLSAKQIESAKKIILYELKKQGRIWINIFPDRPVTNKPAEVRMGKGKGAVKFWVTLKPAGSIIFEIGGVDLLTAKRALFKASFGLPSKTQIITKDRFIIN